VTAIDVSCQLYICCKPDIYYSCSFGGGITSLIEVLSALLELSTGMHW